MDEQGLTQERAQLFLDCVAGMLHKLYDAKDDVVDPNENPMQRMMAGPAKDDFMTLLKLITFASVQKILPMMGGQAKLDPRLLAIEKGSVAVQSPDVAVYKLKPGVLTTRWVNEKGQYKINDFEFKVNWFWVIWNWRAIRTFRQQSKPAIAANA